MSRTPLKLNMDELLNVSDSSPPPELEVVATAASEVAALSGFAEHELEAKIQRYMGLISSGMAGKLPDKGMKIRQSLRQLQAELDLRKLARYQKEAEGCEEARQSRSSEITVSHDVPSPSFTKSEPHQPSTFATLFFKSVKRKADDTLKEKSRFTSRGKGGSLRKNDVHNHGGSHLKRVSLHSTRLSSRPSQFRCSSNNANRHMQKSSNGDCRISESFKISSSHLRGNSSVDSPKKRRASESRDSLHPRSNKSQHVVLLDEEELQPTQSIRNDAHDQWKESMIYYPARDDPESVELSYSDVKCLDPREYLSSPVMNFYIRYLQRPESPAGRKRGRYYFFNTYFYKKLEEDMLYKDDRSANFLKLRRWWKGVNLFQKAYIFLPIHNESHWSLVIICIPTKEYESGPVVLHLDSLGLHSSNQIFDVVHSCLQQEWNFISQNNPPPYVAFSEKIWKDLPQKTEKKRIVVPKQQNEYDCGLFVLYFMERFIEEAPKRLKKENDLSSMFGKNWFKPEDASGLRKRIRELLLKEFENAKLENSISESLTSDEDQS